MVIHPRRNTFTTVSTSEAICVLSSSDGFSGKDGVHRTAHSKSVRVLAVAIVFCTVMMMVEGIGGVMAHSLAVLSDAIHMLADVFALSISLFAAFSAQWEGNHVYSFGWRRAEVIGALISVITTWGLVVWISLSALERTYTIARCAHQMTEDIHENTRIECEVLSTPLMIVLGTFGFAMNIVLAVILHWGNVHAHSHGGLRTCAEHIEHNNCELEHNHNHHHHHSQHCHYSSEPRHVQCKDENKTEQEMCFVHNYAKVKPETQNGNINSPCIKNLITYQHEEEEEEEQNNLEENNECKALDVNTMDTLQTREINKCANCCGECEQFNHQKWCSISHKSFQKEYSEQTLSESYCVGVEEHKEHFPEVYVEVDNDDHDNENRFGFDSVQCEDVANVNDNNNNSNDDQHDFEHCHEHDHCENSHSMNVRAALIHVLGDCLQALGVVLAALVMYCGNYITYHTHSSAHSYYNLADPLLSLLFGVITIFTTKRLIRDVLEVLMERVPDDNLYEKVLHMMCNREEVENVQDIHIWTIGPGLVMLCATVIVTTPLSAQEAQELLDVLTWKCKEMGIHHCTIQITYQLTRLSAHDR